MELFNINDNRVQMHFRMIMKQTVGIFKKEVSIIEHGQLIMFSCRNQLPSLTQFNNPADSGLNHLTHIKRFGNKVRCSHLKGLKLGIFICRQDNNRNSAKLLIIADNFKNFHPVHDGHPKIKQNNRQFVYICPHLFQRFFSVFSIDQLIIFLKNIT